MCVSRPVSGFQAGKTAPQGEQQLVVLGDRDRSHTLSDVVSEIRAVPGVEDEDLVLDDIHPVEASVPLVPESALAQFTQDGKNKLGWLALHGRGEHIR